MVLALLPRAFAWARDAKPSQPLTSGIWQGAKLSAMAKQQLELSDVISFHNYDPPAKFEEEVKWLDGYHRPLICTEYMAETARRTIEDSSDCEEV